jgi:hypothetical protein
VPQRCIVEAGADLQGLRQDHHGEHQDQRWRRLLACRLSGKDDALIDADKHTAVVKNDPVSPPQNLRGRRRRGRAADATGGISPDSVTSSDARFALSGRTAVPLTAAQFSPAENCVTPSI